MATSTRLHVTLSSTVVRNVKTLMVRYGWTSLPNCGWRVRALCSGERYMGDGLHAEGQERQPRNGMRWCSGHDYRESTMLTDVAHCSPHLLGSHGQHHQALRAQARQNDSSK